VFAWRKERLLVKIKRAIEGVNGHRRLSDNAYVNHAFPESGIIVEGVYIPWSMLDEFRESEEMEFEFEPWSRREG